MKSKKNIDVTVICGRPGQAAKEVKRRYSTTSSFIDELRKLTEEYEIHNPHWGKVIYAKVAVEHTARENHESSTPKPFCRIEISPMVYILSENIEEENILILLEIVSKLINNQPDGE